MVVGTVVSRARPPGLPAVANCGNSLSPCPPLPPLPSIAPLLIIVSVLPAGSVPEAKAATAVDVLYILAVMAIFIIGLTTETPSQPFANNKSLTLIFGVSIKNVKPPEPPIGAFIICNMPAIS